MARQPEVPSQARSKQRIERIIDAAAQIIDESGIDAVNATSVAYLSGSSVGSVYRYFPNMTDLLRTLARRNFDKFLMMVEEGSAMTSDTPWSSLENTISAYEQLHRTEPSFSKFHWGDDLDPNFLTGEEHNLLTAARALAGMLSDTHSIVLDQEMIQYLCIAAIRHVALVRFAFIADPDGDRVMLDEARQLTLDYIPRVLPITR